MVLLILSAGAALTYLFWKHDIDQVLIEQERRTKEELLVRFDTRPLHPSPYLNPNTFAYQSNILSMLFFDEKWLIGAEDGLRQYDRQGRLEHRYSLAEGWPQNEVRDMVLWQRTPVLAVWGTGLIFLGPEPEAVIPSDASCRYPTSLLSTPQGDLWIGTRGCGLLVWKNRRLERTSIAGLPSSVHVTKLAGNSPDLWVGTFHHGLWHYLGGVWNSWTVANGLPDSQITSLAFDPATQFGAAGTPLGGIWIQNDNPSGRYLEGEFIESLAWSHRRLFAGLWDGTAYSLSPRERPRLLPSSPIPVLAEMPMTSRTGPVRFFAVQDEIYSAVRGELRQINPNSKAPAEQVLSLESQSNPILSSRSITALSLDGDGRLWIGYFDAGMDILEPDRSVLKHWRDDLLFCINHIHHDLSTKTTYVSTANGLAVFMNKDGYRTIRQEEGLIHNSISQALPQSPGSSTIYAATAGGLTVFEAGITRSLFAFHGLPSNQLYSLAPMGRGIFIGTLAGLSFWNQREPPRNFTRANSPLRHNWVNALLFDGERLWVGTYGGGIQTLDSKGIWDSPIEALSKARINPGAFLFYDKKIFAGTLENGFVIIDPEKRTWTEVKEALLSRNITSFAADETHLFVGSESGLTRFSHRELQSLLLENAYPFDSIARR